MVKAHQRLDQPAEPTDALNKAFTDAATNPAPPLDPSNRIWANPLLSNLALLSATPTNPTGIPMIKLGEAQPACTSSRSSSKAVGALPMRSKGAGFKTENSCHAARSPAAVRVEQRVVEHAARV